MERYMMIKEVGDGTFGNVWRALNRDTREIVAIKKMKKKYVSWEECINLREVKSLRKMNHPNIVKLKEIIRENDILYFVFEYMECNLYQLMKQKEKVFSEAEVRSWCFQVFQGLFYMHQQGYFHRDLKPENLLVSNDVLKIADLGLAREICSAPPYTEYVSTRWYRAPEVLLQSPIYSSAVDMWAMGAIMAEMFTLQPLFPGLSEADEIYKICNVIGSPDHHSWPEGCRLARTFNYQFPQFDGANLSTLIPSASRTALSLITALCSWDPCKRPTALEALQHPFFQSCFYVPPSLRPRAVSNRTPLSVGAKLVDQKSDSRYSGAWKPASTISCAKIHPFSNTGGQRKLDMENQIHDITKNDKSAKSSAKQPIYRPPMMNNRTSMYAGRNVHGVSEAAEMLGNMLIDSGRPTVKQTLPPPMMAGGWHGPRDSLLGRPQYIRPGRPYARKAAG